MPEWRISEVARASTNSRRTVSESRVRSGRSTLIAARRSMRWCCARYTSPMLPSPSLLIALKLPNLSPSIWPSRNVAIGPRPVNYPPYIFPLASFQVPGSLAGDEAQERASVDGLRHVRVEPGVERAVPLLPPHVPGHGDEAGAPDRVGGPHLPRHRVPVEVGQRDV